MLAFRLSLTGCGDDDSKKNAQPDTSNADTSNADTSNTENGSDTGSESGSGSNSGSNSDGDGEAPFVYPTTEQVKEAFGDYLDLPSGCIGTFTNRGTCMWSAEPPLSGAGVNTLTVSCVNTSWDTTNPADWGPNQIALLAEDSPEEKMTEINDLDVPALFRIDPISETSGTDRPFRGALWMLFEVPESEGIPGKNFRMCYMEASANPDPANLDPVVGDIAPIQEATIALAEKLIQVS